MAEVVWESPKVKFAVRRIRFSHIGHVVRMDGEFKVRLGAPEFEAGYETEYDAIQAAQSLAAYHRDSHFDVVKL